MEISVSTVPSGELGCFGRHDGIVIQAEARREGLYWRRGRIWVEGQLTSLDELQDRIEAVRFRRSAERLGDETRDAIESAKEAARGFFDKLKN